MKVTIADIAKMTGLAKSTVSAVINDRPGVNAATKRRVLEVMEQMNYIPNEMARGLSFQSSATIGMIVRDVTNPFYAKMFRAVEKMANQYNYSVILSNTDGEPEQEIKYIKSMIGKRVDGIILDPSGYDIEGIVDLKKSRIPFVVFGACEGNVKADCVEADDVSGAYRAVEYLVEQGHSKIGFVSGGRNSVYSQRRLRGIKDAFLKHGIAYNEAYMFDGAKNMEHGYQVGTELLQRSDLPTAIIAFNDLVAIGMIKAFAEAGKSVPEDLSVIGFDDIDLMTFPLTTIAIPEYEMGMKAAELLIRRIQGRGDKEYVVVTHETSLIVRRSVRQLNEPAFPGKEQG